VRHYRTTHGRTPMRHEYEVFERFPDGSTLFRACVTGKFETQRKIQMLAEHSENEFYAIDIQAVEHLPPISARKMRPLARRAAG
jgi:hypothetical protein